MKKRTIKLRSKFVVKHCFECGTTFAVTKAFDRARQQDFDTYYCPNGHGQEYEPAKKDRIPAVVVFTERDGKPVPRLPHGDDNKVIVPDGIKYLTVEQAAQRFPMTAMDLKKLYANNWLETLGADHEVFRERTMNKRQTYMDALREIAEKRPEVLSSHQITMLVHTALYADRLHEVSRLCAILIERAGKPPVLLPSKGEWNIYSVGDDELYDRITIQ